MIGGNDPDPSFNKNLSPHSRYLSILMHQIPGCECSQADDQFRLNQFDLTSQINKHRSDSSFLGKRFEEGGI